MKKDYSITRTQWNGIEIEIRWNADYLVYDDRTHMAHLEVVSVSPERAPLPITERVPRTMPDGSSESL